MTGFSLVEMLVALVLVSSIGLGVQTMLGQHWQAVAQQQKHTTAVLQLRNLAQQLVVVPPKWIDAVMQRWQTQHQQALPGSISQWHVTAAGMQVVLGWSMPERALAFTCVDDTLPVNQCITLWHAF